MNNFNFFNWIREGVKTSILGGVGDAVETLGMPPTTDTADKILGFLKSDTESEPVTRRITGGASASGSRKLGRSLSDLHAVKEAS
jgi:hypothetical protein